MTGHLARRKADASFGRGEQRRPEVVGADDLMTERRLDRSGGQTLWKQLQQDLVRRLRAGEFDDLFPGELALVEDYAVSRHTVRQALSKLRADGLIVAERGRQPRVATTPEIRQPM